MKKSGLLALSILIVVLAFVFSIQYVEQAKSKQSSQRSVPSRPHSLESAQSTPAGSHSEHQATLVSADANAVATRPETAPLLEAVLEQPVSIEHGGALRELALAKDELYVRNSDGIGRVVSIPSADSASELLGQIEKLQKETGSAPELILYPPGATRDESSRRIVTRDILIEADSRSAADSMASASGLSFKSAPVYAKGKYIYEAPSSPEALAFFVKTADSASPYVTPLLGSLMAKRAMPNDPLVQKQWHLKFQNQLGAVSSTDLNVESVWKYPFTKSFVFNSANNTANSYIRGNGVVIGIVDDGMEWRHPDLAQNVIKNLQYDWIEKDNDPKPLPQDSHGTACAGVAAARGNNRIGVSGVAPEAGLAGMRIPLDDWPINDLIAAETIVYSLNGIYIKNNSWGPPDRGNLLDASGPLASAALKYAADFGRDGKGSILVWAAGNGRAPNPLKGFFGNDNSNYDGFANSIYTIAVAAMDSQGRQADYSENGANIVITAPSSGNNTLGVMTTDNKGPKGYNYGVHNTLFTWPPMNDFKGSGDVTQNFGGTSSATPAVSGVIALMLQRNPNLGWRDVQEILMRSALKIDDQPSDIASGWITANRTDHVTGNATASFKFNDKYGAGLVDAAAAVALSGSWTNLGPQLSLSTSNNTIQALAANATASRTFTVNGSTTRAEHVTLQLTVTDTPKGNLTITLTSPGNTTSTFCIPHSDTLNKFENWKFMTVRSWAENPNGNWTLTVTNNGTTAGNLTDAQLVVYGTATPAANTSVTLAASTTLASLSSNITLNATAVALGSNGTTTGNITSVQFFRTLNGTTPPILIGNGNRTGNATNPATYTFTWNTANTANLTAGNYSITANATSSGNVTGTSQPLIIKLDPVLLAGWDFQTLTSNRSSVPLATALMSVRTYNANFGNGNGTLLFNGSNGSSQWSYANGEIFVGPGSILNAAAGFSSLTSNPAALLLRAGRNLSANGKSLIFRCSSTANKTYTISYAAASTTGGFSTHTWSWSNNATGTFTPMANATLTTNFTTSNFTTSNATADGTLFLRLTPSGATSASGMNLIDNIQIKSN